MKHLPDLFERNRAWAAQRTASDPEFFSRLSHIQRPDLLWIGCSDSRVPANEIVGLAPGELFVHRNVANVVPETDLNALAVIEYAVSSLGVRHIIMCGHYHCGGVKAALEGHQAGAVALWLQPLRDLADRHREELDALASDDARWDRLCELNVAAQVQAVARTEIVEAPGSAAPTWACTAGSTASKTACSATSRPLSMALRADSGASGATKPSTTRMRAFGRPVAETPGLPSGVSSTVVVMATRRFAVQGTSRSVSPCPRG